MSFNFGGPLMAQTVPDGTVAGRESRDIEQRGGDIHYTEGVGLAGATSSVIASGSAGGRKYRDYLSRGGDRNNYLYVDIATGLSVLSGAKSTTFDEAKANTGLYPF